MTEIRKLETICKQKPKSSILLTCSSMAFEGKDRLRLCVGGFRKQAYTLSDKFKRSRVAINKREIKRKLTNT